jgi:hypothetical protein
MKFLTPNQMTVLAARVQQPRYLIEIELDQQYYLAVGETAEIGGNTYESGRVSGLNFNERSWTFDFFNENFEHTMPSLLGYYLRKPARLFLRTRDEAIYVDENGEAYADEDGVVYGTPESPPMVIFSGNISTVESIDDWLRIVVERNVGRRYPSQRIGPPLANYTRPAGSVISFNNTIYRIIRRSGLG